MKTTRIEKKTTGAGTTSRGAHRSPLAAPPTLRLRPSMVAAADRQIAEIERTFTLRYEW